MITTQKFVRKPIYVDAVRITQANFEKVAEWCDGEIRMDEKGKGTRRRFIHVRVHNPQNQRQSMGFVGDWLLYTERGYKIYTNKAFNLAFDLAVGFSDLVEQVRSGNTEGLVTPGTPIDEDPSPETGVGPIVGIENPDSVLGETMAEEYSAPAIPQPNEVPVDLDSVEATSSETSPEEYANKVLPPPGSDTDESPEMVKARATIEASGKRVLSEKEQQEMDPDEVRDLLRSGDVILAQDLAA